MLNVLYGIGILNGAIAVSYLLTRSILAVSKSFSQQQRLGFARMAFVSVTVIFFMIPLLAQWCTFNADNYFQLKPFLSQATTNFLQNRSPVTPQVNLLESSPSSLLSLSTVLVTVFILGSLVVVLNTIKQILVLKKLTQTAFRQRSLQSIHVLFNPSIPIPFCYSWFKDHYVVLPTELLTKSADLKCAIRHELQHVRQKDTRWLHVLAAFKVLCFWNPFFKGWVNWFGELQEFACDEALILKQTVSPTGYAQCLLDAATYSAQSESLPQGAVGILGFIKNCHSSTLERRILMLFQYKNRKKTRLCLLLVYVLSFCLSSSIAYAVGYSPTATPLTAQYLSTLIAKSMPQNFLQVSATPEVVTQINQIRGSDQARNYMRRGLQNMQQNQAFITAELKKNGLPEDFLVLPLVESGYRPLAENVNPVKAAGVWQIIPSTAQRFNLVINNQRDDRMNMPLATQAAIAYLTELYSQFKDWKLAAIAYEFGEDKTAQFIQIIGSKDPWVLARAPQAPKELKNYLALLDASIIIMHTPSLVS